MMLETYLPPTPAAALAVAQVNLRFWTRRLEEARLDALTGHCSQRKLQAICDVVRASTEHVRELTAAVKAADGEAVA
jgi:hypothetical protein